MAGDGAAAMLEVVVAFLAVAALVAVIAVAAVLAIAEPAATNVVGA